MSRKPKPSVAPETNAQTEPPAPESLPEPRAITLSWVSIVVLAIFAFGVWIRLHDLQRMAYHHDESIHSYYSWRLYDKGPHSPEIKADPSYYDPTYHGPFLYHIQALTFFLFGDSDFTGRLPFALSGILILWVAYACILAYRASVTDRESKAQFGSIFGIVAFPMVILSYLSIRIWETLHPIVIEPSGLQMEVEHMMTLFVAMIAVTFIALILVELSYKVDSMQEKLMRIKMERS